MTISSAQVSALLRFLPLVDPTDPALKAKWAEASKQGSTSLPYPVYPDLVTELFNIAGQPCWTDASYSPSDACALVESDDAIGSASIEQIKTMLTYCVRGERFCDGHWEAMIQQGRMAAILRRLKQLRL